MSFKGRVRRELDKHIPAIGWLSDYSLKVFGNDTLAGLTLAAYAIPVSLAYATLAGLPPQYGVYGYLIGGIFYAILGTGKQLAIGPTSAISMVIGITLSHLSGGDPGRWVDLASLTALVFGALSIVAYFLRLSSIINFISETVLLGFKAGAAVTIGLTQLPKLIGTEGGGENFIERIMLLFNQLPDIKIYVVIFGVAAIILLLAGEKFLPGKPVAIIVVALSIIVIYFTPLQTVGFTTVGTIPRGLPVLHIPVFNTDDLLNVLPLAFACFLLAYIETVSAGRALAQKNGYDIDPGQELLALGISNLATSLGKGYPVSGGLSQSVVNEKAGAKTPMSIVITSLTIALSLLFITSLLKYLPTVILASIVLVAVKSLIDFKEMKRLYKVNRFDFAIAFTAMVSVIIFGILPGVLIAAMFSLILIIRSVSSPHVAFLGRIPGSNRYTDIERHPENELLKGVLLVRVESELVYFNVEFIYRTIWKKIQASGQDLSTVVIDLGTSAYIDSSGARLIKRLYQDLGKRGIRLRVAEAHSGVRDILRLEGIEHLMGHVSRRDTLHDVVVNAIGDIEPDIIQSDAIKKRLDISEIVSQIVLGNNFFKQTHPREYFENPDPEQSPVITLVSCSDSHLQSNAFITDATKKVFLVNNIANQIMSTEGSVDYGIYHLKTPLLFFLGHSDCGAIKSYLKGNDHETGEIREEFDYLNPIVKEADTFRDSEKFLSYITEKNLDYQVNIAYKKYKDLVLSGELTIMAGYYDSGDEFDKGMGNIVIVNVNRNKDADELRKLYLFGGLSNTQKELHIGRLHFTPGSR